MIQDILSPFARWGAVAAVFLLVAFFLWRRAEGGTRARDDLEEVEDAERDRTDTGKAIISERIRMRGAALRGWLRGVRSRSDR